jgi:2-keto-4-pentenoate hydratase
MLRFEQLAQDLAQAWRTGGTTPLPEAGKAPTTRAEAYAIQDRMAELIGGQVVGWKVGATAPAVQLFEGHDGPIPGRIFADRCFESPASVPADLLKNVKMECEFAFRTTRAIPSGASPLRAEEIADALTFHPAFELAASRYAAGTGNRAATTFDGIADNGSGGAAIVGPPIQRWRDLSFETMQIETRIDDSPVVQMFTGAYRRDPVAIVVETFSDLRARGIEIAAGSYVLTGSLSVPTTVRKGQTITSTFAGIPRWLLR